MNKWTVTPQVEGDGGERHHVSQHRDGATMTISKSSTKFHDLPQKTVTSPLSRRQCDVLPHPIFTFSLDDLKGSCVGLWAGLNNWIPTLDNSVMDHESYRPLDPQSARCY
jgi:hypothetical protein